MKKRRKSKSSRVHSPSSTLSWVEGDKIDVASNSVNAWKNIDRLYSILLENNNQNKSRYNIQLKEY